MVAPAEHRREGHRSRTRWIVAGVVTVSLLLAGGVVALALHTNSHAANAASLPPPPALTVVATTPTTGATGVAPSTTVSVAFSTALATDSPVPTFDPPIVGSWSAISPTELQFVSAGPLDPGAHETMTVPGGDQGVSGQQGQHLDSADAVEFNVAPGSTLRLQQLLAELGYLPVTFTPTDSVVTPQQQADDAPGTFSWRWAAQPATLTSLWAPGVNNVVTRGAVMRFENAHGLPADGSAGAQVWADLLEAAATGTGNPDPYGYVSVSESRPETVTVYRDGAAVYSTRANTGVSAAPTARGTFPVYLRYTSTTMSGTNPDGSHYSDPGIPWVSYFNGGDALHGFNRPGYGYPQSDGCVEMPPSNAAVVYPMTPIGTLVTVA
jgi:peptidoglycan hydrolase-like protein with peptidoglycan-binding domain